jgi:hypothetical protein
MNSDTQSPLTNEVIDESSVDSVAVNSYNSELDVKTRVLVSNLIERGKSCLRRSAEETIEFGKVLIGLKELLPHGSFIRCVESEYEISEASACKFMNVARRFEDKPKFILDLTPTALYTLAAPSTPPEVIDEVFNKVVAGETIKATDVTKMIEKAKKATKKESGEESSDLFDNLDEVERKELEALETRLKEKMESLITEVESVKADLDKLYKKVLNRAAFSEKASLVFKVKKISTGAHRVFEHYAGS